jgi:hypothetical protein
MSHNIIKSSTVIFVLAVLLSFGFCQIALAAETPTVQLESWTLVDSDTVRVLFNLPDTTGVSGSGSLTTIHFTVTGTVGATLNMD